MLPFIVELSSYKFDFRVEYVHFYWPAPLVQSQNEKGSTTTVTVGLVRSFTFFISVLNKTLKCDFKVARQPLGQGSEVTHIQERHLLSCIMYLLVGLCYVHFTDIYHFHAVLAMDMDGGDDCY